MRWREFHLRGLQHPFYEFKVHGLCIEQLQGVLLILHSMSGCTSCAKLLGERVNLSLILSLLLTLTLQAQQGL